MARLILAAVLAFAVLSVAHADPDPVADFPSTVDPTKDLVLRKINSPANIANNGTGGTIYAGNVKTFPGLSTQGLSYTYAVIKPGGEHLPHWHFRASELIILLQGKLQVDIVDSKNNLYEYVLNPLDQLIVPRGSAHSLRNLGDTDSINYSAFNSENPGTGVLSTQLFTFPVAFQTNAFQVNADKVKQIDAAKGPGTTPAYFAAGAAGGSGSGGGGETVIPPGSVGQNTTGTNGGTTLPPGGTVVPGRKLLL